MSFNLEELALKSIEQYASLSVRLVSLEQTLLDNSRRAEANQEKFISACDKIIRLEERISSMSNDKEIIHKRIDDTKEEIDKLIKLVNDLAVKVKTHGDTHCDDCENYDRMDAIEKSHSALEKKIEAHTNGNRYQYEVRKILGTHEGLSIVKFLTSKWFTIFVGISLFNTVFSVIIHHDILKTFVGNIKFW